MRKQKYKVSIATGDYGDDLQNNLNEKIEILDPLYDEIQDIKFSTMDGNLYGMIIYISTEKFKN